MTSAGFPTQANQPPGVINKGRFALVELDSSIPGMFRPLQSLVWHFGLAVRFVLCSGVTSGRCHTLGLLQWERAGSEDW